MIEADWRDVPIGVLEVGSAELDLPATLDCGQAFRWRLVSGGWWVGVIEREVVRVRQEGNLREYQVFPDEGGSGAGGETLRRYLRLDVDLSAMVADFSRRCSRIQPALRSYPGIRVLAQPPEEALLSFLCSPANSVSRISRSIDLLARTHGSPIARLDGIEYHAFPDIETLAGLPDPIYRAAGLGWRGLGIRAAAARLLEKPPGWMLGLRGLPYSEARSALLEFPYVGPKIADCVCLFGLLKDEAVPVDTHIWQIARDLFPDEFTSGALTKTLTAQTYSRVLALYQERYGPYAGWAQQYLFHWRRQGCPT